MGQQSLNYTLSQPFGRQFHLSISAESPRFSIMRHYYFSFLLYAMCNIHVPHDTFCLPFKGLSFPTYIPHTARMLGCLWWNMSLVANELERRNNMDLHTGIILIGVR
jgi:hypothetical protein